MSKYYDIAGIDDSFYSCDICENKDGRETLHWEDKDFDICEECFVKLGKEFGFNLKVKISRIRISEELRNEILERDGYKCRSCGAGSDLCLDHKYAFVKGGRTEKENLQTLCRSCNSRKGIK